MTACDTKYERLIDQMMLSASGQMMFGASNDWEKLRQHMKGCEPCRNRYNRVVLAERMLHGGPDKAFEPSPLEFERIAGGIFGQEEKWWQRWLKPRPVWTTGLVAAAAAVVLVPLLMRTPMNAHPPEPSGNSGPVELFQSRGGAPVEARQAGLRAFCIEGAKVQPLDPKGTEPPRCDRSSQLKLAVSNPGNYKSVFLVGMDDDHAPKWYAPKPLPREAQALNPVIESVPAPNGVQDTPVGGAVKLEINHGPGRVRIFALFSDKPVRSPEVEAAVDELAKRHVTAQEAEALPLRRPDVLQRSLLVDIAP